MPVLVTPGARRHRASEDPAQPLMVIDTSAPMAIRQMSRSAGRSRQIEFDRHALPVCDCLD